MTHEKGKRKNQSNLSSPASIVTSCEMANLSAWAMGEATQVQDDAVREAVLVVCRNLPSFVRWPSQAVLLWRSAVRAQGYFKYPAAISAAAREAGITLDGRANGPAIAAFLYAGGERPPRFGSQNSWSVHHIYSGKFPYPGAQGTLHAVKSPLHFTQSAGLVAMHPIADQMADEFPFFSWLLRAEAYVRFGYDPDHVFGASPGRPSPEDMGFENGHQFSTLFGDEGVPAVP